MSDDGGGPGFWAKTFGVNLGRIELQLVTYELEAGETIRGRLHLHLAEPTAAKRLVVGLRARQEVMAFESQGGERRLGTRTVTAWQFERELDGPRLYGSRESFDFALTVPDQGTLEAESARPPEGVLGDLARFVKAVATPLTWPARWEVGAFLHLPWKLNVTKRVDVQVRRPRGA